MSSFARRQQYRRLRRMASTAAAAVATFGVAGWAMSAGAAPLAAALLVASVPLVLHARRLARLAGRSRVGANSEAQVQRALEPLRAEGWRLRHSLVWPGGGDIDHVAIAPPTVGVAFAIETKTRTWRPEHLARTSNSARWLAHHRRRWCPHGALPVLCVVRAAGVERVQDDVLIVSLDRLPSALRTAAGTRTRPAFLSPAS